MDIDQKMKSVKEIWNKKGSFVRTHKPFYEQLDTAGENLTPYQQTMVKGMLNHFLFSSIDAWLESMPKEVKKGIMKMDMVCTDDDDGGGYGQHGFVGQFLSDTYDSDGELNFESNRHDCFAHKTYLKMEEEQKTNTEDDYEKLERVQGEILEQQLRDENFYEDVSTEGDTK